MLATSAGCGGTAVVESGSGGAGATGSTNQAASSSSGIGGTSSVSSGNSSAVTTADTAVSSGFTSTGSGPSNCDGTGNCGDSSVGCLGCAIEGPCADLYNTCASNQECIDFSTCLGGCQQPPDPGCLGTCMMQYPAGGDLYLKLIDCAVCQQCPGDCAQNGFWDCAVPPP